MEKKLNVKTWIEEFLEGNFDDEDIRVQILAGWYDWFCKDSSLKNKTKRMGNIIKKVQAGGKIDLENWYIWFKNNCPLNGPLYDDFRFADIETGEVQFTIQIDCCWNLRKYVVWGRKEPGAPFQSDKPLFETDEVKELVKWFNSPWEK